MRHDDPVKKGTGRSPLPISSSTHDVEIANPEHVICT
jgi:hypothetical protein